MLPLARPRYWAPCAAAVSRAMPAASGAVPRAATATAAAAADGWQPTIGLEVHAHLATNSKLFSPAAAAAPVAAPNTCVTYFDAAFPGTLPVLNTAAVDLAVRAGLALCATVSRTSSFDRKHYFYPDLPHGYQITQYRAPVVVDGHLDVVSNIDGTRRVRIARIQLEQDSGKSQQHGGLTFVDLNRAGVGMLEIVSEPDIRSSDEAGAFVRKLQHLLRHMGICRGNMELGEMRVDVNVSLHRPGGPLGVRCEVKNINSVRNVVRAIDYEIQRQRPLVEAGQSIRRETRAFDAARGVTVAMRAKEDEVDYRFMPEPDLPLLQISEERLAAVRASMPELPDVVRRRLETLYAISSTDAALLVDQHVASYFEQVALPGDGKRAATWILNDMFGLLNEQGIELSECSVSADRLRALLDLIDSGYISNAAGKQVLQAMFAGNPGAPIAIVDSLGLAMNSSEAEMAVLCENALRQYSGEANKARGGNSRVLSFLVGVVLKQSPGANPAVVAKIMKTKLGIT